MQPDQRSTAGEKASCNYAVFITARREAIISKCLICPILTGSLSILLIPSQRERRPTPMLLVQLGPFLSPIAAAAVPDRLSSSIRLTTHGEPNPAGHMGLAVACYCAMAN
ncbi:hypothetical protein N7G274_010338 [Stereocaulon virgatum]|uniref:Uncharacterized protein n=1 Tax=Stereocaulon virgatum TaxID=373712 RepID=A0ABR3ZUH9_9LECA